MATEKQVAWLQKLAKWKGVEIDVNRIKELDNGQLDEVFEHLKDLKVTKEPKQAQKTIQKQRDFNGQRFGLACKLVLEHVNFDFVLHNREEYIKRIGEYYLLLTDAEQAFKSAEISVEPDADFLYEMARDRALIADGVM